jgi:Ca2+-dependent lipid-binding protein
MQLNVRVVSAKGLAKMDTFGKSDPFVELSLTGTKSKVKTSVKDNTLTPVWNEEFKFVLYNPARQSLALLIKDQDVAADDDMATLTVQLATIPIGRPVEKWYDLVPVKGVKVGGQINLVLHVGLPGAPPFQEGRFPPWGPPPYAFHIRLISGSDIERMDGLGKSDPYVVLSSASETFQTSVKKNTLTPKWEEDFHFSVPDPRNFIIKLLLRDEDVVSDDDISSAEIQTGIFPFGVVLETDIELQPVGSVKKGGKLHGLFHLSTKGAPPFVTSG